MTARERFSQIVKKGRTMAAEKEEEDAMMKRKIRELLTDFKTEGGTVRYYDVTKLDNFTKLPYSLRVILECAIRKLDTDDNGGLSSVWIDVIDKINSFASDSGQESKRGDILFHPGRVLLQDFTGVPALIDLAAIRESVSAKSGEKAAQSVDSACPADLVVDHSVQVDYNQIKHHVTAAASPPVSSSSNAMMTAPLSQQPTIIVHSTFPPPCTCHYQPTLNHFSQSYVPPLYSVPAYYPMSSYQDKTLKTPSSSSSSSSTSSDSDLCHRNQSEQQQQQHKAPPNDNPGLPIQDEICPFHQRISHWAEALRKNQESEFNRNWERFQFLKWVNSAFNNITVIPPGTGIMHQVNLEYLARVVTCQGGILFPDSVVGTDTHTTMINGLGVLGWGVGTLDAQAVMFGHPVTLPFPEVVGVRIRGQISDYSTSTDLVLMITKKLRQVGVQGKFVEFFGPSLKVLSVADRATIANMCPEYGALVGFFPIDDVTIQYLAQTGRQKSQVETIEEYMKRVEMFRHDGEDENKIVFSSIVDIDLSDVIPCVSGPKRTKDKVPVGEIPQDFQNALFCKDGPKGYGLPREQGHVAFSVNIDGSYFTVGHGTVLLAAISSCTNTSNPSVMLGAGLLAKKAVEAGLSVPKVVKTSLAPGSGVVTSYLQESGVMPYLYMLGFEIVGYGCSVCAENSGPNLPDSIVNAIKQGNLVCCGLLSGNRNFEGRLDPDIRANYLASPLLVIAYAIAGQITVKLDRDPIGYSSITGLPVFLKDIWPSRREIQETERLFVIPAIFRQVYSRVSYGNKHWNSLQVPESKLLFPWNADSSYIKRPEYIQNPPKIKSWSGMRCLLKLGDDITSDHISPAGSITRNSPAADYLSSSGLTPREYNSYGARRGNYHVMIRGTFSNMRLRNYLVSKPGPFTVHMPSGVTTAIFDAAEQYKNDGVSLYIIGGKNFGRGTSRDWATRGPFLLGVKVILAVSFDATYRSNLVKTGILPLQISTEVYDMLKGRESLDIPVIKADSITIKTDANKEFEAIVRIDNDYEMGVFRAGGVIAQVLAKKK